MSGQIIPARGGALPVTQFPDVPRRRRFVSVTTFRQSGQAVATPMWFGWSDAGIVVVTPASAGR